MTATMGLDERLVEETLARCRDIVRKRRSSRHPFVKDLDRIRPDRAALGRWAVQKYHQVYMQNVVFSAVHVAAQAYEDVRQYAVRQLVAEETAITSGSAPHYELMRRFAETCAVPPEAFDPAGVSAEVREYVDVLVSACTQEHFVLALVTIHSIESQSGESVGRALGWLRVNHIFTDHQLEWFVVHAEQEDDHAAAGLALVKKYASLVPDFGQAAPRVTARICDAWLGLHDHYLSLLSTGGASAAGTDALSDMPTERKIP